MSLNTPTAITAGRDTSQKRYAVWFSISHTRAAWVLGCVFTCSVLRRRWGKMEWRTCDLGGFCPWSALRHKTVNQGLFRKLFSVAYVTPDGSCSICGLLSHFFFS